MLAPCALVRSDSSWISYAQPALLLADGRSQATYDDASAVLEEAKQIQARLQAVGRWSRGDSRLLDILGSRVQCRAVSTALPPPVRP
jgi:hypothetical protein